VDICDVIPSISRASRSRVLKNDEGPAGPLHSSFVCHDSYRRFNCSVGNTA